jgi:hypothetical protein
LETIKTVAIPTRRKKAAALPASPKPKPIVRNFPQENLLGGSVTVGEKRVIRAIRATPTHRFKSGDRVRVLGHRATLQRADGAYSVLSTLPYEGGTLQYRVRSDEERYERIVAEADLEPYSDED